MIALRIPNATRRLGQPVDWNEEVDGVCVGLDVIIEPYGGGYAFVSAWEPTPEELAALNTGGSVRLRCVGGQPPVALWVEERDEE